MKNLMVGVLSTLALVAAPVYAQALIRPSFFGPDGQKKVGAYVWVWRSGVIASSQAGQVEADCPLGRVALSGGYALKSGFLYEVVATKPNPAFDGWVLIAIPGDSGPATVTVYALCAPAS